MTSLTDYGDNVVGEVTGSLEGCSRTAEAAGVPRCDTLSNRSDNSPRDGTKVTRAFGSLGSRCQISVSILDMTRGREVGGYDWCVLRSTVCSDKPRIERARASAKSVGKAPLQPKMVHGSQSYAWYVFFCFF